MVENKESFLRKIKPKQKTTNKSTFLQCIYNTFYREIKSFRKAFFADGVILPFVTLLRLLFYHSIT